MTSTPIDSPIDSPTPGPSSAARPVPLRRSATDRMVGGVCGGLAAHLGIDALLWRLGFVALALVGGCGFLLYPLLWVLVPPAPRAPGAPVPPVEGLVERLHGRLPGSSAAPRP